MQIHFKNLDKSQLAIEIVEEKFHSLIEKFPLLSMASLYIILEMENSPIQAGPDFFKVKVFVKNGKYRGVVLSKSNTNLYHALSEVIEHMLELLNRFGDKKRVVAINKSRKELSRFSSLST